MSEGLAAALRATGMDAQEAAHKGRLFGQIRAALAGAGPPTAFFVPGRLEVLGKHTDYAGGLSLLCAVERGFCVVAAPRADHQVRVVDFAGGREVTFPLSPDLVPTAGDWANYAMTVGRRIARNFPDARRGVDVAFASDLPGASGLSSSSALLIGLFLALAHVNDLAESPTFAAAIRSREDFAGYLATVENGQSFGPLAGDRGVGTFGGSEDHTAILCCRPGHLSQYAFCPVRPLATLPFPSDHVFLIAVSGVAAEKTGGARDAFNRMSFAVGAILDLVQVATGSRPASLAEAVADPVHLEVVRRLVAAAPDGGNRLRDRLEHFLVENGAILPAATAALAEGRLGDLGALVDRSQAAAEQLLGNQVPETIALARRARERGATAASAFGAGFGGGVWALVRADDAGRLAREWAQDYAGDFPEAASRASFFAVRPGPAAVYPLEET